jgi:hypothetical protein
MLSPLCNSRDESDGNLTDAVGIASGFAIAGRNGGLGGGVCVWVKVMRERPPAGTAPSSVIYYALLIGLVLDAGTDHFSHLPVSGRLHFFFSLKGIVGVLLGAVGTARVWCVVPGHDPRGASGRLGSLSPHEATQCLGARGVACAGSEWLLSVQR